MRYAVVIEKAGDGVSAYVPDLPGCIATAADVEAVTREIRAAIRLHVEGLRAEGDPIPEASSLAEYVEAGAPPGAGAAVPAPAMRGHADGLDPFGAFSEWASPFDDEDYADL